MFSVTTNEAEREAHQKGLGPEETTSGCYPHDDIQVGTQTGKEGTSTYQKGQRGGTSKTLKGLGSFLGKKGHRVSDDGLIHDDMQTNGRFYRYRYLNKGQSRTTK